MIRLIATPEQFNGRRVRVIGFAGIGFESSALYLHEEDFRRKITENALALEIDERSAKGLDLKAADLKYVIVEATFSSTATGHMGSNAGGLENVTRLEVWP
jgi:hypothetical protein